MTTSKPYLTLPESDEVPWLVARACAGEWDYQPEWLNYLRHPAVRKVFKRRVHLFVVPDLQGDRARRVGVEVVRRLARRELANKEVKHFEVVTKRQHGLRSVPHRMCGEKGCDGCRGLGVTFMPDVDSHVDLMGWVAVIRVA